MAGFFSPSETADREPLLAVAGSWRLDAVRRRYHTVSPCGVCGKGVPKEVTLAGELLPPGPRVAQA